MTDTELQDLLTEGLELTSLHSIAQVVLVVLEHRGPEALDLLLGGASFSKTQREAIQWAMVAHKMCMMRPGVERLIKRKRKKRKRIFH